MYMLKRIETPNCNIDNSVEFILRGAKKRRSMAMANARMLNAEQGIQQKLVAVKQNKPKNVLAVGSGYVQKMAVSNEH